MYNYFTLVSANFAKCTLYNCRIYGLELTLFLRFILLVRSIFLNSLNHLSPVLDNMLQIILHSM